MTLAADLLAAVQPFGVTSLSVSDFADASTWRFTGGVAMDVPGAVAALQSVVEGALAPSLTRLSKELQRTQAQVDALAAGSAAVKA